MSYQEIYEGLNKKASNEVVCLAKMLKEACLKKQAAGKLDSLKAGLGAVKSVARPALNKMKQDIVKLPGQAKNIFAKPSGGYIQGDKWITPTRMQVAKEGLKDLWQNNDTFRRGVKLTAGTGAGVTGAKIMKARGYKEGANDIGDAAKELIGAQNQVLKNTMQSNTDWKQKYKKEVGGGFWEGLLALLRRLFSGEGYAE